jgi:hypothetical protein
MSTAFSAFRAVDTYHMSFIAHYTFLSWKVRRKRALPGLKDKNDLPSKPQECIVGNETHMICIDSAERSQSITHDGEQGNQNDDLPSKPEKAVDIEFGDTAKEGEHEFSVLDARQQTFHDKNV